MENDEDVNIRVVKNLKKSSKPYFEYFDRHVFDTPVKNIEKPQR